MSAKGIQIIFLSLFAFCACVCSRQQGGSSAHVSLIKSFKIDKERAQKNLTHYTKAPHVFGSSWQSEIADWLRGLANGFSQKFDTKTPNPVLLTNPDALAPLTIQLSGQNIVSIIDLGNEDSCLYLLGSHYDTKLVKNISYLGANDGGSSSILLLEIKDFLEKNRNQINSTCDLGFVWFDGEEPVLPEWSDGQRRHPAKIQDNTYGSRHFVSQLSPCPNGKEHCLTHNEKDYEIKKLILLDMVGMKDVKITLDSNSTPELQYLLKKGAQALELTDIVSQKSRNILDDHIPFIKAGIPSIDIIDFNNTHTWHNDRDTLNNVSLDSIEKVGRLALYVALSN